MEIGESVSVPIDDESQEPTGDKIPVNIRCILLFDGTGNNKTNIQSRLSRNDFYKKTISLWSRIKGDPKGDDSYENNFTNIASLDTYLTEQPADGYDITTLVYTEGAGTRNNQSDKLMGFGFGTGVSGVTRKFNKALADILNAILDGRLNGGYLNTDDHYIQKLTIDVFGFSRGAATARYAIYKLLLEDGNTIEDRLEAIGFDVKEVEVSFAGLFDTVSSHGILFSDDVAALNLDAVRYAKKALHLVAADEYRKNFALTNIKSADANGIEYYMPGVHSDVGGSYHESSDEQFQLYSGRPESVKRDAQQLIEEGWYQLTNSQKEIIYREIYDDSGQVTAFTRANRFGITNAYCQIPLKLMAHYARDQGVPVKPKLEGDADSVIHKYPELVELDQNIYSYMTPTIEQYHRNAPLLKLVRNRHLHMSSTSKLGMGSYYTGRGSERRRSRRHYDG